MATEVDAVLAAAGSGLPETAGASVCLVEAGRRSCAATGVAWSGEPALVTPDTLFPLGSVTKVLVATVVCRLATTGAFGLDDRVARFVPELRALGDRGAAITVRQLLCHTSGLADSWGHFATLTQLFEECGDLALLAPGEVFSYSNTGYAVLGRLVRSITGLGWEQELRQSILRPARIDSVTSVPPVQHGRNDLWPPASPLFGAAGAALHATARDTARVALACATGRTEDGRELLPAWMCEEMVRPQVLLPGTPLHFGAWGLGWALPLAAPAGSVQHVGGTSAFVHVEPDRGVALAVLTNFSGGWKFAEEVRRELLGGGREAPPAGSGPVDPRRYAGEYASPTFGVTVRAGEDDTLMITKPGTVEEVRLRHRAGDSFWADFGDLQTEVTFLDLEGGRARRVHAGLRLLDRVG